MGYRDDRAALEHQIKVVEQELAPLREELRELDGQRESLRREIALRRRTLRRRRVLALLFGRRSGGDGSSRGSSRGARR